MTNWYKTGPTAQPWRLMALAALLATGATAAQAQGLDYIAANAQNLAGTYTDLGTTGTVITTSENDNANSAATPIGFTFTYNGTPYTDFVLNTNGFIKMGTTAPSAANITNFVAAPDRDIIAPLGGVDLTGAIDQTATPTEFRVATTGTAGSRVCTIQWENLADKGPQFRTIQFQVRLYEGTSRIEFVYGAWTAGTAAPIGVGFLVGLKGSSAQLTDRLFAQKSSSGTAWTSTIFAAESGGSLPPHFVRNTFLPDPGRTYRFTQAPIAPVIDASVAAVYSLGKLPIPIAVPHTPQAVIRNTGNQPLTNLSVTATAPAPNDYSSTKTIATLAVGASAIVSFDPYTPTTARRQVLTVTLTNSDANSSNNINIFEQEVNATTFGVAEPGANATSSVGLTAVEGTTTVAGTGILAVKYTTNAARSVAGVTVRLEDVRSVGRTVYTVVMNSAGTIIGRTPDYVIQAADVSTYKTFTLATPVSVPVGSFFVGMAQAASPSGTAPFFPLGLQAEVPTRTGTFYSASLDGTDLGDAASANLGRFMVEAVMSTAITCVPQTVTTFPYSENFDGVVTGQVPCGYTVSNVNADDATWTNRSTVPGDDGPIDISSTAPNAMTYYWNEDGQTAANDWFFTPSLFLRAGNRYQLSFKYLNSGSNYPESLEVKYGLAATPAAQTTTIWNNPAISSGNYSTANATSTIPVLPIEPTATGNYNIGFHVYSPADQFFLAIDDLQVTASVITGSSAALDYAISVFPNPSEGVFNVDIKGAKAKGDMQLEVINSLGQIVHKASVRDNQLNKLDLSNLAAGMYVLKVKSGNDFSVRNLSIQK